MSNDKVKSINLKLPQVDIQNLKYIQSRTGENQTVLIKRLLRQEKERQSELEILDASTPVPA